MIIETAMQLLDEGGIESVGARSIGRRAHYHRSTVMYHIGSIGDLHRDLWLHVAGEVAAAAVPTLGAASGGDWCDDAASGIVTYWREHRNRMLFFVDSDIRMSDVELDETLIRRLYPGTDPARAAIVAQLAFGMLGSVIDILDDLPPDQHIEAVASMCRTAIDHVSREFPVG